MQVARKITIPLALSALLVLGITAWLSAREDISLQDSDMSRDQQTYGQVLGAAILSERQHEPTDKALGLVNEANRGQRNVLFLYVPEDELATKGSLSEEDVAALKRGETLFRIDRTLWGNASTWVPLNFPDRRGALWVQEPLAAQRESLKATVTAQVGAAVALGLLWVVVAVGLGTVIIGRPMKALAEQARRIGQGDLSSPLKLEQSDEIGELALEMNRMADELAASRRKLEDEAAARLRTQEQLRHADRLNTVGKLASGLAHELGTPLNVISARARMIASGEVEGEASQASARIVVQQSETITRIIRQLLDFARRTTPSATQESLNALASSTLTMLGPLAEKSHCHLAFVDGAPVSVWLDRGQVQQALTNLVMNAVQAMPSGGEVKVSVGTEKLTPPADVGGTSARFATLSVKDEGEGIAPELLPRIFEPFFTTKDVGEGTGLGLSVAWGIVRDHHGWIGVDSEPGKGSRFTIYLPLERDT